MRIALALGFVGMLALCLAAWWLVPASVVGAAAEPQARAAEVAVDSWTWGTEALTPSADTRAEVQRSAPIEDVLSLAPGALAPQGRAWGRWIEDLRDDDVRWNAQQAVDELQRAPSEVEELLGACLDARDRQQRKLAALVLARRGSTVRAPRLAECLVEDLAEDEFPWGCAREAERCTYTPLWNASCAAQWLAEHPEWSRAALEAAADSGSVQQQLAVSALLALDAGSSSSDRACVRMIAHLADNDVSQDAALAFDVLATVGPRALPFVERAWPGSDAQQRELLRRLFAELAPSDARGVGVELESEGRDVSGLYGMVRPSAVESLTQRWLFAQ
ncbi:MAG: hypothetical protein IT454_21220 [Planctomycetes bacterium]|nr:hypothetical protein [Planctomycetota bacterium]